LPIIGKAFPKAQGNSTARGEGGEKGRGGMVLETSQGGKAIARRRESRNWHSQKALVHFNANQGREKKHPGGEEKEIVCRLKKKGNDPEGSEDDS